MVQIGLKTLLGLTLFVCIAVALLRTESLDERRALSDLVEAHGGQVSFGNLWQGPAAGVAIYLGLPLTEIRIPPQQLTEREFRRLAREFPEQRQTIQDAHWRDFPWPGLREADY